MKSAFWSHCLSSPFFLFGLLAFFFFWNLGAYPLMDNNEGLYARIAVEMLESGNWIIPHLNGVPYIEKPPMLYWLTALSFKIFGVSDASARLVPALSGFGLCGLLYGGLSRFSSSIPQDLRWVAPLLMGTSLVFGVIARIVYFDVLLTFFLTTALLSFYTWCASENTKALYAGYVALALATLTKGLLAPVLAGLVMLSFFIIQRIPMKKIGSFLLNGGPVLYALIVVPWHLMAHLSHAEFSLFYFINEHWNRFLDQRVPRDYYRGPFYYYVPRMLLYILPWVGGLVYLKKAIMRPQPPLVTFCLCWFLCFFLFFSLSKAKANYYMIAGLPPLCILMGWGLIRAEGVTNVPPLFKRLALGVGLVLVSTLGVLFFCPDLHPKITPYGLTGLSLSFRCGSLAVLGSLLVALWTMRNGRAFLGAMALFNTLVMVVLTQSASLLSPAYSSRDVMQSLPREPLTQNRVYLYKDYENISTTVFYAGHPLPLIDSHSSDLLFGQTQGTRPDLFLTWEQFQEQGQRGEPLYVIARPLYGAYLESKGLKRVASFQRHVVFVSE